MTRRERMEARLERRRAWAESRAAKGESTLKSALGMADAIPFGQPILVGHHSERRDRNYRERIASKFEQAAEHHTMAAHHEQKADGLAAQLEGSIFSDDPDAVKALEAKIADLEAWQANAKRQNAIYRKAGAKGLAEAGFIANTPEAIASYEAAIAKNYSWDRQPVASCTLKNRNATLRATKKRLEQVKIRQARVVNAEAAGGVLIEGTEEYIRVTFAEKPERATIEALKAAGFGWGGGSWTGRRADLPESVAAARRMEPVK